MPSYIKQTGSSVGFGLSEEEALEDAYINSCMVSLTNDTKELFTKRREELHPWMPRPNMLHISTIGCLVYEGRKIVETKTGTTVVVATTGNSIFQYMSELFSDKLSYTDIVCVLREEIDTFFQNISEDFISIRDMPIIQVQRKSADFIPKSIYRTTEGMVIGCIDNALGIRFYGADCFYVCYSDSTKEQIAILHRLLYRTGYTIIDDNIVELPMSEELQYH